MPKPCCGARLAARAVLRALRMTAGGWPLAGKAHIGHDHSLAHWSRPVRMSAAWNVIQVLSTEWSLWRQSGQLWLRLAADHNGGYLRAGHGRARITGRDPILGPCDAGWAFLFIGGSAVARPHRTAGSAVCTGAG